MLRRLIPLVALLLELFAAHPARANAAAPLHAPDHEGGAFIAKPTTLVVEHEELSFRCDAGECLFEAVYHVLNPGESREDVVGAFYGIEADRLAATANRIDARRTLTPDEQRAIDDSVAAVDPSVAHDRTIARQGFALGLDAGARGTLIFSGRMRPVSGDRGSVVGYAATPPLETRHPWLGTRARRETTARYAYAMSPIREWAGSPSIDVTVRCPNAGCWGPEQEGWTLGQDDAGFVARRTIAAHDATTLSFAIVESKGTTVLNGGPFAGVGARLDARGVRARFGYEVAVPWWLIWSAAAETNFSGTTTLVALGEVAAPDVMVFIPSLGLGAGVPVQFRSGAGAAGTQVGARLQLTVSFPVLSIVLPVDVFPGASSETWQAALFAQASF